MKDKRSSTAPISSTTFNGKEAGLTGLLGGTIDPKDPLAFVGLGVGATQRAKDLVLKGIEFELQQELTAFIENELGKLAADKTALNERRKSVDRLLGSKRDAKGRPTKGWLTIDVERAAVVIDAANMYFERFDRKISSQEKAIEIAMQMNAILVKNGDRNKGLFRAGMSAIRNSVSKGLKEFPEERDRFIEK